MSDSKTEARFWAKVNVTPDCWEWTAALNVKEDGYGSFGGNGQIVLAHRFSYVLLVGPIPEGLTLDHLCRNRRCVNPDHLEPVTLRENILRGEGLTAKNARKTHCPSGHPYSGENLYVSPKGDRRCRSCRRERIEYRKDLESPQRATDKAVRS
jgi:hypothetical protein